MFLIPLASKSYKLEHNPRKMSRKVLRFSRQLNKLKKRVLKNYFRWNWDQKIKLSRDRHQKSLVPHIPNSDNDVTAIDSVAVVLVLFSSVTYPAIWRCHHISRGRCGCECGGCASLKEMIHLQLETTASPERDAASPAGDAVSPEGDLLASPNFGICDTTR
jgi:hypothetical protein